MGRGGGGGALGVKAFQSFNFVFASSVRLFSNLSATYPHFRIPSLSSSSKGVVMHSTQLGAEKINVWL